MVFTRQSINVNNSNFFFFFILQWQQIYKVYIIYMYVCNIRRALYLYADILFPDILFVPTLTWQVPTYRLTMP